MEILEFNYFETPSIDEKIALCLGFFDGIHLGHKSLIEQAQKEGYKVGVLTFDECPAYALGKISENLSLSSNSDKAEILSDMGVDYLFLLHFDLETSKLTKDQFIDDVLKPLNPVKLFCGEDYRFGARAEGNPTYLSMFFDIKVVNFIEFNGHKISSRNIIKDISEGKVEQASQQLGRNYRINGLVSPGFKNGTNIMKCPTANVELDYPYILPKLGVYSAYAYVYDIKYKAVVNVGLHPTINPLNKPIVEAHIFDFDGNIYGKDIFIEFVSFIRGEKLFASTDELIAQIAKDEEIAKKTLK